MKNQIYVFALFGIALLFGWLIWGIGGRIGDVALGVVTGGFATVVFGIYISKKGASDG